MSYADITFNDKNPIKRWLQNHRLISASVLVCQSMQQTDMICDFGAGNGELCKMLAANHPHSKITCYEPTVELLHEAKQNLANKPQINFQQDIKKIAKNEFDIVFCLEVFEHLPPRETFDALQAISDILKTGGKVVIGVPNEIGIPALYKGIFRISRRYGAYDANIKNVILSLLGFPPKDRPESEIAPGLNFHHPHTGFDHRFFKRLIERYFKIHKIYTSPITRFGLWLMPEIYFYAEKTNPTAQYDSNNHNPNG